MENEYFEAFHKKANWANKLFLEVPCIENSQSRVKHHTLELTRKSNIFILLDDPSALQDS